MKLPFKTWGLILPFAALTLASQGCKKDDCQPGEDCHAHEQELITKLQVQISDSATGTLLSAPAFNDPDGVGGNAPTIDTIHLDTNKAYTVASKVFAEHDGHSDDITAEILAEGSEHIFCFTVTTAQLSILRTDSDGSFPIGISSLWNTGSAGQGSVRITLKHQPDGAKDGTCTPGDTDVEVDFPVVVQ